MCTPSKKKCLRHQNTTGYGPKPVVLDRPSVSPMPCSARGPESGLYILVHNYGTVPGPEITGFAETQKKTAHAQEGIYGSGALVRNP